MNKAFRLILGLFLLTGTLALAQLTAFQTGGRAVASQYGSWQVRTTNAISSGSATIQLDRCSVEAGSGNQAAGGGKNIIPWATNAPIAIIDSSSEVVTVSSFSTPTAGSSTGCSVTATFSNAHGAGATVMSGSDGLMEAANDIAGSGGVVVIDPSWSPPLGTFGLFASSTLVPTSGGAWPSNVIVEDLRNGLPGQPVYWALRPTTLSLISAGSAPTNTTGTGGLSSGAYRTSYEYLDQVGGISLPATDSSQTGTVTQVTITAPSSSTGAIGYIPMITAAGGSAGTEIEVPVTTSVCANVVTALSGKQACAFSSNALINANPSSTAKEVTVSTAHTTFGLVPFNSIPAQFQTSFGPFAQNSSISSGTNADVAQFYVPAQYFNSLGKAVDVCFKATGTLVATGIPTWSLTASNQYAQSPVTLASIVFATRTGAVKTTQCYTLQTAATGASGTFWATGMGVDVLTAGTALDAGADTTTAVSSALDLTKGLYFAVNLAMGTAGASNVTVESLTIRPSVQ